MIRSAAVATAAVLLLAACGTARVAGDAQPTAEERVLLAQLTRDSFVVVERLDRDEDGYLIVRTSQGRVIRRYRFVPDIAQGGRLRIHRLIDEAILNTDLPERIGGDVDPRRPG